MPRKRLQRLAELGYVTLASDLYGEGKNASTLDEAMAFVGPRLKDPLSRGRCDRAGCPRYHEVTAFC
jgi:dienelactone hydrolase